MMNYRDNNNICSDEESENSDKEQDVWKRKKRVNKDETFRNVEESVSTPIQNKRRKTNNVWSVVLQDQLMAESLDGCLLKNKPRDYGSRGQESYDYTLKYGISEDNLDCSVSGENVPSKSKINSVNSSTRHAKIEKLTDDERAAAHKLIKVLSEKKHYLIFRVVKEVGIEKSMSLLQKTEEIEENGGMMTKDDSRQRTPGGVFLQLLKKDENITKQQLKRIFKFDMLPMAKKFPAKNKRIKPKRNFVNEKKEISENVKDQNVQDVEMECCSENNSTAIPMKKADSDLEDGELISGEEDSSIN